MRVVAQQSEISWTGAVAVMVVIGLILVGSGWLVIWVARRAASGELGRNGWAGVRTRTTSASDEAWLAAQQAAEPSTVLGGQLSILTGIFPAVAGLLIGRDPDNAMEIWSIGFGVGTVLLLVFVIRGALAGQAAAKQVNDGQGPN